MHSSTCLLIPGPQRTVKRATILPKSEGQPCVLLLSRRHRGVFTMESRLRDETFAHSMYSVLPQQLDPRRSCKGGSQAVTTLKSEQIQLYLLPQTSQPWHEVRPGHIQGLNTWDEGWRDEGVLIKAQDTAIQTKSNIEAGTGARLHFRATLGESKAVYSLHEGILMKYIVLNREVHFRLVVHPKLHVPWKSRLAHGGRNLSYLAD